ncbi:MAG TPA: hypothetical protein ENJ53_08550 [Phaeodactylibacter sp.]|nr:hypothetical protein [Phaeodactylibacter sp.]
MRSAWTDGRRRIEYLWLILPPLIMGVSATKKGNDEVVASVIRGHTVRRLPSAVCRLPSAVCR